jgi:hypothetical protein
LNEVDDIKESVQFWAEYTDGFLLKNEEIIIMHLCTMSNKNWENVHMCLLLGEVIVEDIKIVTGL